MLRARQPSREGRREAAKRQRVGSVAGAPQIGGTSRSGFIKGRRKRLRQGLRSEIKSSGILIPDLNPIS